MKKEQGDVVFVTSLYGSAFLVCINRQHKNGIYRVARQIPPFFPSYPLNRYITKATFIGPDFVTNFTRLGCRRKYSHARGPLTLDVLVKKKLRQKNRVNYLPLKENFTYCPLSLDGGLLPDMFHSQMDSFLRQTINRQLLLTDE